MEAGKPLLILDIDETLVYACESSLEACEFVVGPYGVNRRPHLNQFLATVSDWYELAVWTSASSRYAQEIIRNVFPNPSALRFVWTGERCVRRYDRRGDGLIELKDLNKLKRQLKISLDRVVMIDDTPEKLARHYGNYIRVQEWRGAADDTELLELLPFMEWLKDQSNFRTIEKRGWRTFKMPS